MAYESKARKNLLVLTSGGDAPGMNAAIRAVVRAGLHYNLRVYGALQGYLGLVSGKIIEMKLSTVRNCIQRGGTLLRTARCLEFHEKKIRAQVIERLKALEIEFLVVIGGDGSFRGATLLHTEGGIKVVGIPATIDNDILGTEYCIGHDSASNSALEAIDRIRDTADSHNRCFIIEVMGRDSGFLACKVGIAGGAEFIIIPEREFDLENLAKQIMEQRRHKRSLIIVTAEAGKPGGSFELARKLNLLTNFEYKVCVLGHIQRGGSPTAFDRIIASRFGVKAVEKLLDGTSNAMIALNRGEMVVLPFPSSDITTPRTVSSSTNPELSEILANTTEEDDPEEEEEEVLI